jgi:hypothetical protein
MAFDVMSFAMNEIVAKSQGATDLTPAMVGSLVTRSRLMGLLFTLLLARNEAAAVGKSAPSTGPNAPIGLTPTPTKTTVGLAWTQDTTGNVASYILTRMAAGVIEATFPNLPGNSSDFTDYGLINGTTYVYTLIAVGKGGQQSPAASATTTLPG